MTGTHRVCGSAVRAVGSALAMAAASIASDGDAIAGQPQRADAQAECLPGSSTVTLHLHVQEVMSQRQLGLRLWGEALHPHHLPFDIELPRASDVPAGSSGLGDARSCAAEVQGGDCESMAVTATIYVIGSTEGAEIQGQVTAVGRSQVPPAGRTLFVGWVRVAGHCL